MTMVGIRRRVRRGRVALLHHPQPCQAWIRKGLTARASCAGACPLQPRRTENCARSGRRLHGSWRAGRTPLTIRCGQAHDTVGIPVKPQTERCKEAARRAEADEPGEESERAFRKIVPPRHRPPKEPTFESWRSPLPQGAGRRGAQHGRYRPLPQQYTYSAHAWWGSAMQS
jgi:hypothetical protein